MRQLWMAALCALAPLVAQTATAPDTDPAAFAQVLALLAARHHGQASFTEVHTLGVLERPLQSSGELIYDAPDHLEKRTLAPRAETLILDRGVLTAQRGHHRHVLALAEYPQVVPFVESIRATLAGDRAALERYFTLTFSGTPAHWTLELTPTDAALARSVRGIRIAGERDALRTVEIRQSDGDTALMTIGAAVTP
jgi:outer membrane lipoprotein-sorting protein